MDTMGTLDLDPSTFYVRNNAIFNATLSKHFKKLYHNFITKILHLPRFFYLRFYNINTQPIYNARNRYSPTYDLHIVH